MYAELSYFDGAHFQHIADWHEHKRLERIDQRARQAFRRKLRPRLRDFDANIACIS
jgi:hypothetical protein